jgi:leucyl aminopeptidase (aminopeptidase T)
VTEMSRAIDTILGECLGVQARENVVVVTDPGSRRIAESLVARAREMGAEAVLIDMAERETDGTEPPAPVAAAMLEGDVLIAPTTMSLSHTEARRAASERGARAATMPHVTEEMLIRTMGVDYADIRKRSAIVAERLTAGGNVHIASAKGTDLRLSIEGRKALSDDGDLKSPGSFGNLPAGEGFVAPVEGTARGKLVFDGSIRPIGLLHEPLVVEVVDGYAVSFAGPAAAAFRAVVEPHGREAFAVAELGIGTNDAAELTGEVLEDEKIMGTIHVAFGDNHTFGGTIRVPSHLDGVVMSPTVAIDGTTLLEDGRLLLL